MPKSHFGLTFFRAATLAKNEQTDPTEDVLQQPERRERALAAGARCLRAGLATTVAAAALTGCAASTPAGESKLTVFAAASLIKPFDEVEVAFESQNPGIDVVLSYASSSTLAAQINAGARADVLAAADPTSMTAIHGLTARTPANFASNVLTVAVPPDNHGRVTGISDLARPELRVGLCDPSAPCGRLAVRTLAANHVAAEVDTYEPNNQALFTRLQQGELDVALIYRSDAHSGNGRVESLPLAAERAPEDMYQIAALRNAVNGAQAQRFVEFVTSAEGQAVLASYGFGRP
jgi:molybdate transport system substrate-binding protein